MPSLLKWSTPSWPAETLSLGAVHWPFWRWADACTFFAALAVSMHEVCRTRASTSRTRDLICRAQDTNEHRTAP